MVIQYVALSLLFFNIYYLMIAPKGLIYCQYICVTLCSKHDFKVHPQRDFVAVIMMLEEEENSFSLATIFRPTY